MEPRLSVPTKQKFGESETMMLQKRMLSLCDRKETFFIDWEKLASFLRRKLETSSPLLSKGDFVECHTPLAVPGLAFSEYVHILVG